MIVAMPRKMLTAQHREHRFSFDIVCVRKINLLFCFGLRSSLIVAFDEDSERDTTRVRETKQQRASLGVPAIGDRELFLLHVERNFIH